MEPRRKALLRPDAGYLLRSNRRHSPTLIGRMAALLSWANQIPTAIP
jgi:hypothetical protein